MRSRIQLSSAFFLQLSATFGFLSAATGPAQSQDIVAADTAIIEEIVVTTRKRQENLQEVPISIGVFNSDEILRIGIRDLADVTKLSPSLQFDKSYSQNSVRVTIRGLSNTRGRANVAFLVDGIDVSSETTGTNAGSPMLINQRTNHGHIGFQDYRACLER
jgi:outer membrane receptor protein involved in Fe transport